MLQSRMNDALLIRWQVGMIGWARRLVTVGPPQETVSWTLKFIL